MKSPFVFRGIFFFSVLVLATALRSQEIQITVDIGHRIARDIDNHMPGLAGGPAAVALGERVGDAVYTGVFFDHGVGYEKPMGTNAAGTISSDITVTTSGSFSGTVSGGAGGVISGSMTAEQAQSVTGTHRYSITWQSAFNGTNNRVTITYVISIKDEMRIGILELPVTKQHLEPTPENPAPQPPEGGGEGNYYSEVNYWFDFTWYTWGNPWANVPEGTVTIGPITVYDDGPNGGWNT